MGEFSNALLSLYSRAAADQGGVISGDNPTHYNPGNPIRLWIIQLLLIIAVTQLLAIPLSRLRQPRVIAEVIAGVILGPTVMGRIPGFKQTIFPEDSIPLLTITSTIGLILFLFLVGLEIDTRILRRNLASSALVSVAGLVVPLGLGAALAVGIYREFIDDSVNFGHFLLFVSVAVGITAFPVLCRILTELKLLDTEVGLIVLSAGIGNDVVGWILLALTVALVNASSGLTALWVLLACAGYTIFLLYPGRWAFRWLAKRTGSLEQGAPTPAMMTVTLLVVFVSAFFTDIIGVHAIFGGFIAGLIVPHDNGFAISIVEKIEDLVSILFLPIYFTLSGLKTNLGLLDDGKSWGYTIIICLVAFSSKFFACGGSALLGRFNWREAGAIGALMSCKGLVELIVLNIGLQANILDGRTFSMFVVHALVLTVITTPLTIAFYPSKYRQHYKDDKPTDTEGTMSPKPVGDGEGRYRFSLVLDKIEQLRSAMVLTQLLHTPPQPASPISSIDGTLQEKGIPSITPPVSVEALRLIELSARTSAVLRSQEAESLIYNDPVISLFQTFGQLNNVNISANLSVVNHDEFPEAVARHATDTQSQMVIVPWPRGITSALADQETGQRAGPRNPFDGVFHKTTTEDQTSSVVYSEYIRRIFATSPTDVALFVERAARASRGYPSQHLFLAFFGGPDDRAALSFLVQLCANPALSATVVRIIKTEGDAESDAGDLAKEAPAGPAGLLSPTFHNTVAALDTVYGHQNTQTRLASDTADNILWERFANPRPGDSRPIGIDRITFSTASSAKPLHHVIELAKAAANTNDGGASSRNLIVFAGRSRRLAVENLHLELRGLITEHGASLSSSVPKTLGDVGAAMVAAHVDASLLVIQAAPSSAA